MKKDGSNRSCGDCQACCYFTRIDEIEKPAYTRCKLQCETGCSKYEERPDECRNYKCTWLLGYGDEDARPDKIGAMFTARSHPDLGPWVSVHFDNYDSIETEPFQKLVSEFTEKCTVIEMLPDTMRVVGGPQEQIDMFIEHTSKDLIPVQNLISAKSLVRG